jgi:arsenite methyltransferase
VPALRLVAAKKTNGSASAASSGTISILEESAQPACTSGLKRNVSRAADGRRTRIGTRSDTQGGAVSDADCAIVLPSRVYNCEQRLSMPLSRTSPVQVRDRVRIGYSAAAEHPDLKHEFPVGRKFAESIGYPSDLLASLPAVACDAFAGVSNVSLFAELPVGATVLDLGCGSGTDMLIAARRVGASGKVIGVDFSGSMLSRARQAVSESGIVNVELRESDAERLPIADGEIDIAIVNGIFNLNPAREAIFSELARVIRPSGTVYAAELILSQPLPPQARVNESDWFA